VIALRRYLDSEGSGLSLDTVPPRSPD